MIDPADNAEESVLMGVDVTLELIEQLEIFVAQATSSKRIQSIMMNLREMLLFLVLVGENLFAEFASIVARSLLLNIFMDPFVMTR